MTDPGVFRDAGLLREHLASELARWRAEGFWSPSQVERFYRHVRLLARLARRPRAEVYRDLEADADALEAGEGS